MSLTRGLGTLALEVLGIFGAAAVLAALTLPRRPKPAEVRFITVAAVAVVSVALALSQLASAGSTLNQGRRAAVSASAGIERCFQEKGAGSRIPFIRWAKARMGPHAVYALAQIPPPDLLCVVFVLLPALPAAPGQHVDWTVAFGAIPGDIQARIGSHDPSVQVFAPGFALARNGPT